MTEGVNDQIRRAREHDPEAWAVLWEAFGPVLLGLGQRLLGPRWPQKSVSDLLQTTWLRAYLGIQDFRGGASDEQTAALFRAWLAIIMRRALSNERRYDQARPLAAAWEAGKAEEASREQTPSVQVMQAELQGKVRAAMAKVSTQAREVLCLRFFEGLSDTAIAARLGLTLHQARYRREQAQGELKAYLEGRDQP